MRERARVTSAGGGEEWPPVEAGGDLGNLALDLGYVIGKEESKGH